MGTRTVKLLLKSILNTVAPRTMVSIQSARARAHSHRLVREWGLIDLNRRLIDRFGPTVQSGPFKGMALSPMTQHEALGPFLLGTYEAELHPWLSRIMTGRFDQVLDVGAKFGYYAVGLARQMPRVSVVTFDTDSWARAATREMAAANGTKNVTVTGFCSPRWLDRHLESNSFIFCDCEGYEAKLFGRATTPALATATIIVEIHDQLVPGAGDAVRGRLAQTHIADVVHTGQRPIPMIDLSFLSPADAEAATREIRDPQEWLLFTPRPG
jgi:predicted O-methyltransferase YrrM